MANTCTICRHPKRQGIDAAFVAGTPRHTIARKFGVSSDAVYRHVESHIPERLAKAKAAAEVSVADDLLSTIAGLEEDARRIGRKAEETGDLRTALAGIREITRIVELLAKLRGELQDTTIVNLMVSPEWLALRTRILEALAAFPDARRALAGALDG